MSHNCWSSIKSKQSVLICNNCQIKDLFATLTQFPQTTLLVWTQEQIVKTVKGTERKYMINTMCEFIFLKKKQQYFSKIVGLFNFLVLAL